MARTVAGLPEGTRITDFISLGVVAKTFPMTISRRPAQAPGLHRHFPHNSRQRFMTPCSRNSPRAGRLKPGPPQTARR